MSRYKVHFGCPMDRSNGLFLHREHIFSPSNKHVIFIGKLSLT